MKNSCRLIFFLDSKISLWQLVSSHSLNFKIFKNISFMNFYLNIFQWVWSLYFSLKFLPYIGLWLIDNVVLVSDIYHSDSVIFIHISVLFLVLFPFRLLQNIEQSSLCHTEGPCWLSILYIEVCSNCVFLFFGLDFISKICSRGPGKGCGSRSALYVCLHMCF